MSTLRVDTFVVVSCDRCQTVSDLVPFRSGWRYQLDYCDDGGVTRKWRFYGHADVHLCPDCVGVVDNIRGRP